MSSNTGAEYCGTMRAGLKRRECGVKKVISIHPFVRLRLRASALISFPEKDARRKNLSQPCGEISFFRGFVASNQADKRANSKITAQ